MEAVLKGGSDDGLAHYTYVVHAVLSDRSSPLSNETTVVIP